MKTIFGLLFVVVIFNKWEKKKERKQIKIE